MRRWTAVAVSVGTLGLLLAAGARLFASEIYRSNSSGGVTRTMKSLIKGGYSHNSSAWKTVRCIVTSTQTEAACWEVPNDYDMRVWGDISNSNGIVDDIVSTKKHLKKDTKAFCSFGPTLGESLCVDQSPNTYFYVNQHVIKKSGTPPSHADLEAMISYIDPSLLNGDTSHDDPIIDANKVPQIAARCVVEQTGGQWTYTYTVQNYTNQALAFEWPSVRASGLIGWSGTVAASSTETLVRTSTALPRQNVGHIRLTASGNPKWGTGAVTYYPEDLTHPSAVTGLGATVNGDVVTLNWTNNGTYDNIYVYLEDGAQYEGELVAGLPGGTTSAEHTTTLTGALTYTVVTVKDWLPSEEATVTVTK